MKNNSPTPCSCPENASSLSELCEQCTAEYDRWLAEATTESFVFYEDHRRAQYIREGKAWLASQARQRQLPLQAA